MIVYSSTKAGFINDVDKNQIADEILEAFERVLGYKTAINEYRSWQNSMKPMRYILDDLDIPDNVGIAIEYKIPQTSRRVDFIITGEDADGTESVVLIELKQWEKAELTEKDGIVRTFLGGGVRETYHPSYQAWSYASLLEDYNQTIQDETINLQPCAYLHNYYPDEVIDNAFYGDYTSKAPVFIRPDELKLREFIKTFVKHGDTKETLYRIDHGKIKPSKNLADELSSMLSGNQEFIMIDDQKIVYETALKLARDSNVDNKNVLIVQGGPGTGKSVVAINLLVELTNQEMVAQYITRNSAPREVYQAKLSGTLKKSRIANLFSGSGSFHAQEENIFDVLVVDEAHRLNEKSGMFSHLGQNQVLEIVRSSKLSIFFLDEDQRVTLKDIGDTEEIKKWATQQGAKVTELKLESQFRCNGSDGYLSWLDNTLQIRDTANPWLDGIDYDFRVMESPQALHNLIKDKNIKSNKARLVAGYCWKWVSKKHPEMADIVIGEYEATWNLDSQGQAWIIHPDSVSEVGCIHTSQGLEVDYIGVIIGQDFVIRDGMVVTNPEERASTDKSIHGWKALAKEEPEMIRSQLDSIIKNTYRTLMTRGQKGCYIYCTDAETQEYFRNFVNNTAD